MNTEVPNDDSQLKIEGSEYELAQVCEPIVVSNESELSPVSSAMSPMDSRRRRTTGLPYTFHSYHGKNIRLTSSDTVAVRFSGYNHAIAVVSHPLRRGHNIRFRVDKVNNYWDGSVCIGGVPFIPSDEYPPGAMGMEPPMWTMSSDIRCDGYAFSTHVVLELENLREQAVLTLHFRFSSQIVLDINGTMICTIGTVPRTYSHVFPLIDLYGRVTQVSVLLHPVTVVRGSSLDLPDIAENLPEETLAEGNSEHETTLSDRPEPRTKRKTKAYSQDNIVDSYESLAQPGPSTYPDPPMPDNSQDTEAPIPDNSLDSSMEKVFYNPIPCRTMHQSLILTQPDNDAMRAVQRSHSTHNFRNISELDDKDIYRRPYMSRVRGDVTIHEQFCDTNIQHNDRYPEANDVDNLDNEIMDALTLETGNLPDLTEEQSSSIDESTRRDDLFSEPLTLENLNYLTRVLCLDQDDVGLQSLEAEWEASGEGCEHLHLVLKYWNFLVNPYPQLRHAVSWGQVRCYCNNCQPDAEPPLAGWVRIERIDGVGAATRGFWHIMRSTLGAAQAATVTERDIVRRPRCLTSSPSNAVLLGDIWLDEEGKPHHTILAIEIDIEGSDADNDRLLAFLIHMKSNALHSEDNPPSLEE